MSEQSKIELDPQMVKDTVARFRYRRPTVYGEALVDSPIGFSNPFDAYDFGSAAYDTLVGAGVEPESHSHYFSLQSALAEAAKEQVPNAEVILLRRQKVAEMLNRALRMKSESVDPKG